MFTDEASDLKEVSSPTICSWLPINLMPAWKNQIILFLAAVKMHKNNTFKSYHV